MFSEEIKDSLLGVLKELGVVGDDISLEHPGVLDHGDYSTNFAIAKFVNSKSQIPNSKSPKELAETIVKKWQEKGLPKSVDKVEVAGAGFINIWLSFEHLVNLLSEVLKQGDRYGSSNFLKEKKILLEHTSPNPQTTIMLGHLRNNFLGMAVAKILEFAGAKVSLDDVVNDRGVHLCRSMFGYLVFGAKTGGLEEDKLSEFREVDDETVKKLAENVSWKDKLAKWVQNPADWRTPEELGLKSDHANLIWYVLGSRAYKLLEEVQLSVKEILQAWESGDKEVLNLWQTILAWSEKGYAQTYQRIGSHHDQVWHESEYWQKGKEIVEEGLQKGIFRKSEGAIVTDLERYGLPDNVVVKSDGTALYLTQDLAVTKLKKEKFPADLYIWDIGMEQTLYFKQLFKVIGQLEILNEDKLFHLSYALINFKGGGKMATRKGDVVMADEILDELHQKALQIIKETKQELRDKLNLAELDEVAEKVALAAIKYSLLKYGRETTMFFDSQESLALQGNSGPYVQYTYARTQSVLAKSKLKVQSAKSQFKVQSLSNEELTILRTLYRFPEIVEEAGEHYAPNVICNFLYDLCQKFNLFYDKNRIIDSETEEFRLLLTQAVGQVISNGLILLGIDALGRM